MTLFEVNEAAEIIYDMVDPSANLIFGAVVDSKMSQEVQITLIATGFGGGSGGNGGALASQTHREQQQQMKQQQIQTSGRPVVVRADPQSAPIPPAAPGPSVKVPEFLRRRKG